MPHSLNTPVWEVFAHKMETTIVALYMCCQAIVSYIPHARDIALLYPIGIATIDTIDIYADLPS